MRACGAARISRHRTAPEARTVSDVLDSIPVSGRTSGEGMKGVCVFVTVLGAQRVVVCGSLTTRVQLIVDKKLGNGCAESTGTVCERLRVTWERLRGQGPSKRANGLSNGEEIAASYGGEGGSLSTGLYYWVRVWEREALGEKSKSAQVESERATIRAPRPRRGQTASQLARHHASWLLYGRSVVSKKPYISMLTWSREAFLGISLFSRKAK